MSGAGTGGGAVRVRPDRRLAAWRLAAGVALAWEAVTLAFWPVVAAAAAMAGCVLFGVAALVPGWVQDGLGLACVAGLAVLGWRGARLLAWPDAAAAERRLERDSGLRHRPFATLRDAPAGGAEALWAIHRARAAEAVERLRLRAPQAGLAAADPYALRMAALLVLAAGLGVAGPQAASRLAAGWPGWPHRLGGAAPVIQAWVQPPSYTGLAPIFLPAGAGTVSVPVGGRLTVSVTGLNAAPRVALAGGGLAAEALGQGSWQASGLVGGSGVLSVGGRFFGLAEWHIEVVPNPPPSVAWAKLPGRAGTSLATALPWQVAQRWGVAALEARLAPAGRPDLPARHIRLALPGTPRQASGVGNAELAADPYAGVTMTATLEARDVSGQHATSAAATFVLPARSFRHPLARAIADLRRRLALHPEDAAASGDALAALAEAGLAPPVPGLAASGVTLNLGAAAALLTGTPGAPAIAEVQARLWTLALALDGALPDAAAAALQAAREDLRRGLEAHARGTLGDKALAQKMQALRDALDRRLAEMARQAVRQGALQRFDPQSQHLSAGAIDRAIARLERALREGRTEDARQAMAALGQMMEQLNNAHIMSQAEAQQQEQAQRQGRQQMGAVQDMVQRETGLLDHAQQRAPRAPAMPPVFMQDAGRPDLLGPQGTEDPSQAPDALAPGGAPPVAPPAAVPDAGRSQVADARTQRALGRALDALRQGLTQAGQKAPGALDEAGRAMADAAGALARHDDPPARDAIGRAIAALQQGGQAMAKSRQGQGGAGGLQLSLQPGGGVGETGEDGEGGPGERNSLTRKDPFGRQVDGSSGVADDPDLRVPDAMEQGRSRAIQEELRRRGADRARPKSELDYIDRLLRPF